MRTVCSNFLGTVDRGKSSNVPGVGTIPSSLRFGLGLLSTLEVLATDIFVAVSILFSGFECALHSAC